MTVRVGVARWFDSYFLRDLHLHSLAERAYHSLESSSASRRGEAAADREPEECPYRTAAAVIAAATLRARRSNRSSSIATVIVARNDFERTEPGDRTSHGLLVTSLRATSANAGSMNVDDTIERAHTYLLARQRPDGRFDGDTWQSAASTAQVVIGGDPVRVDSRLILDLRSGAS